MPGTVSSGPFPGKNKWAKSSARLRPPQGHIVTEQVQQTLARRSPTHRAGVLTGMPAALQGSFVSHLGAATDCQVSLMCPSNIGSTCSRDRIFL